jgi:hypothetical protein
LLSVPVIVLSALFLTRGGRARTPSHSRRAPRPGAQPANGDAGMPRTPGCTRTRSPPAALRRSGASVRVSVAEVM